MWWGHMLVLFFGDKERDNTSVLVPVRGSCAAVCKIQEYGCMDFSVSIQIKQQT